MAMASRGFMNIDEIKRKILQLLSQSPNLKHRKILLVYNPRSSRAAQVRERIFEPLREISGVMLGKYEVLPTDVDDNAEKLAKMLTDGDIVIAAGGDGTATIGLNGVMLSNADVRFMAVPFGNFNDTARTLAKASGKELYPLEALVNGKHYRFAACYFTLGMFAESTKVFDEAKMREKLRQGNKGVFFSLRTLAFWYFRNRKARFLPDFELVSRTGDGVALKTCEASKKILGVSDYLAVNGLSVAKIMKVREGLFCSYDSFIATTGRLNKFTRLVGFMLAAVFKGIPGEKTAGDRLVFDGTAELEIQAEGEYKRLKNVHEIIIRKAEKSVKIL